MKNKDQIKNNFKVFFEKLGTSVATVFKTLWRWTKRTFWGAGKEAADAFSVEAIDSPGKEIVKNFFSKKLAVVALVILVIMFFLVFVGPSIWPMDINYTYGVHANLSPGYNFAKIPSSISKDVKDISSFSYFSVGISNEGKLAVWGNTKIPNSPTKADLSKYPDILDEEKVLFVSAGFNHAVAITESNKIVCWGEYDNGQYGSEGSMYESASMVIKMPEDLQAGTIDASKVSQLACGYQVTAIVMKDGSVVGWGNYAAGANNIKKLLKLDNVVKVDFLRTGIVALLDDGTLWFGKNESQFAEVYVEGATYAYSDYFADKVVKDFACSDFGILVQVEGSNKIITLGVVEETVKPPVLADDENITGIDAGTSHFIVATDKNTVYAFGSNAFGESEGFKEIESGSRVYAVSYQNYVVDSDNNVTQKNGLKGYIFGTDDKGRDVFVRIIHGGKMTMTIGAVAVIISSIIGIIIGVISGYFGGWVDVLLMRVTEVFASIPFLPFAIILSAVLAGTGVTENTRIFMIMVVLGLLSWTGLARMIRGQVLAEREKEFVVAAKAMGVKESRIAFKHILPNVISVILVNMTLDFAGCMLTESSLSYLGFGVVLPRPTWGNMLDGCSNEIVIGQFWWRWLFPALFLLVTTICINVIGDTLRDVMDPKSSVEK